MPTRPRFYGFVFVPGEDSLLLRCLAFLLPDFVSPAADAKSAGVLRSLTQNKAATPA